MSKCVAVVACIGMLLPQFTFGASPAGIPRAVRDIELQKGGVLVGQVLNVAGQPAAKAKLELVDRNGRSLSILSDDRGNFRVAGVRGGVYQMKVSDGYVGLRLWANGTAPPSAQNQLLMLNSSTTVRGQDSSFLRMASNPWIISAAVIAAIAIPIALDKDAS